MMLDPWCRKVRLGITKRAFAELQLLRSCVLHAQNKGQCDIERKLSGADGQRILCSSVSAEGIFNLNQSGDEFLEELDQVLDSSV